MHKYLIAAAAALVLSPLATACDECDEHAHHHGHHHHAKQHDVSYERHEHRVIRVPAAYEVSEPRFVSSDFYASDEMRFHHTKPAAAYRLEREENRGCGECD